MQTKKRKIISGILLLCLLVNFVSALETEIGIKTMPGYEVNVAIGESSGEGNNWKFFKKTSNEYGDAIFAFPINTDEYDLIITIKKDGELLKHSSFDNPYKSYGEVAGESINLDLYPDWFAPLEPLVGGAESEEELLSLNETIDENETTIENGSEVVSDETEVIEDKEMENKELTGSSVAEEHASSGRTFYYGTGLVILLMISFISFLAMKKMSVTKRKKGKEKLDTILDEMDSKGKPKKKKKDLVDDVKKKMKQIEDEMEELKGN
ncbi:MAG: hypothetical protein PVJ67_04560 [Candidatus Pacearchaeota archaeon]|jgi:hypothetical protein